MKSLEKPIVVFLFSALIILCFLQIVFRSFLNLSLSWTEELARYTFIALVYVSACAAVLKDAHVRVEIIDSFLPKNIKPYVDTLMDFIFLFFMGLIGFHGIHIAMDALNIEQLSPAMRLPMGFVYAIIPITFFATCIRLIQKIYYRFKNSDTGLSTQEVTE